jgi:hypothetical protein
MSQATFESAATNAEILKLTEKLLRLANLQADTALKQTDTILKQEQTRYLPWQVWTAGVAAGAALVGAAIALGHWL